MIHIKMAEMQISDIPEVARIERACFSQPWSEDGFRATLEQDCAFYLVARLEEGVQSEECERENDPITGEMAERAPTADGPGKGGLDAGGPIVGYCGLLQSFEEAEILNVAVRPQSRGQGVAGAMLRQLMEIGRERGIARFILEVRESNAAAIHLYEKAGFLTDGVRKNFYEKPLEDAVIMSSFGNISR